VGGSAAYQQLPGRRKLPTNQGSSINFTQTEQERAVIEGTQQCDLLAER